MLPSQRLSTMVNELTAATHVMQSSSSGLSTLVLYGSTKCYHTKVNT